MRKSNPSHISISLAFALSVEAEAVVFDARSPSEFKDGHIPGSLNLPLLDDEQRALVGTCYKKQGRQEAIDLGFQLAAPLFLEKIQTARLLAKEKPVLVYCARGGLRSEIITWLLKKGGFNAIQLPGGYKQWRAFCLEQFQMERNWVVVSGMTGVGKTEILHSLERCGEAILDLEGFAQHKGSAFGGIGQPDQERQEQFENHLAIALSNLPSGKRCWVEDESRFIGKLRIPDSLYDSKVDAKRIVVERSFGRRLLRVLGEYGNLPREDLKIKTQQLSKRLGFDQVKKAVEFLDNNEMAAWATMMLTYYDKPYQHGFDLKRETCIGHVDADEMNQQNIVEALIEIVSTNEQGS